MKLVASCAFGLEALVARELQARGYETQTTGPGQIEFSGDWSDIARANLWLRTADRVSVVVADFHCDDFDTLFEATKQIDWRSLLSQDAKIHVTGSSVKSQLSSVPAVQRTVKKAIVASLLGSTSDRLAEDGPLYRVHIGLRKDQARLTIDTTGPSLHKRGYREISTKAPLKETLAAALVQLSFWNPERPLIDPFCGGGTILIEAALIGRNLAPGQNRSFSCEAWSTCPSDVWEQARLEARAECIERLPQRLIGTDIHAGALSLARRNADVAGVADEIHFQVRPFAKLSSKQEHGCIITNPPYGDRLDPVELQSLYESMPIVLRNLPTWSYFILTAFPRFERLIGKSADRRRKLYNGRIECTYYQFHGPPPRPSAERDTDILPIFGGVTSKDNEQAEIFANRLKKRARHLRRWPTRRGITCYRIYERDIPEIPLVVDRYEDHLHIVEFERPHERDLARHADWLELMRITAANTLEVPLDNVVLKSRMRQAGLEQHEKLNDTGEEIVVREDGLEFLVNLTDYQDTGLFLDHRAARKMIRDLSEGQRVLNLFAYTGAFSVYAAAGQAREIVTVDWSHTYLDWARRNIERNNLLRPAYQFERDDTRQFLQGLDPDRQFDIIVCDPPTFSNSKRTDDVWSVQEDHAELIRMLLLNLAPDGRIFFSSNYRRFKLDEDALRGAVAQEITKQTVPEDFRNQRVHRSWWIRHA